MNETELIKRIRQGDPQAVAEVVDAYGGYAARIIGAYMGLAREDMEEALSDVFLLLWQSRERLDAARPLKPYIAAIARNAARRKLRGTPAELPLPEDFDRMDAAATPEQTAETAARGDAVFGALDALEPANREIFLRYYYMEQTTAEIAKACGMNRATVMSRLARGRMALKKELEKRGYHDAKELV